MLTNRECLGFKIPHDVVLNVRSLQRMYEEYPTYQMSLARTLNRTDVAFELVICPS